jgi:hypothetical protein
MPFWFRPCVISGEVFMHRAVGFLMLMLRPLTVVYWLYRSMIGGCHLHFSGLGGLSCHLRRGWGLRLCRLLFCTLFVRSFETGLYSKVLWPVEIGCWRLGLPALTPFGQLHRQSMSPRKTKKFFFIMRSLIISISRFSKTLTDFLKKLKFTFLIFL